MNTDKELMRFIRAAVKNGGSVDISFYQAGNHITASVENAYMILPNEEKEVEVMDFKDVVQKYFDEKIEERAKEYEDSAGKEETKEEGESV